MSRIGLRNRSSLALALLLLAALACNLPSAPIAGAPKSPCSVTPSKAAADQLVQRISSAAGTPGQQVTVTASSEEVSSLLVQSLAEAQSSAGTNIKIDNPVVCFTSGRMTLTGKINRDNQSVDGQVVVSAGADKGKVAVKVEELKLGPVPLPESVRDEIASQINDSLNQNLDHVTVSNITFDEGQMTITGTAQ